MWLNAVVGENLIVPFQTLMEVIVQKKIISTTNPAQLFIGFDEIHNFDLTSESTVIALRRVMRLVRKSRVWIFVLGMQSPLELTHAAKSDERAVPFHSFVPSLQLLAASEVDVTREKMKPLNDFSSVEHLSQLGRPLWSHCSGMSSIDALEFVSKKLFCGQFKANLPHVQMAFLSYRVGLD